MQVGAAIRGTLTAVRDFGAFVDLKGIEGLLPTSELSCERGQKALDVIAPGDVVEGAGAPVFERAWRTERPTVADLFNKRK